MTHVGGILDLDLRRLSGHELTRAVQSAVEVPRLGLVTFTVKRGQVPPVSALRYVRDQGRHVGRITVVCDDPATIGAWIDALTREVLP